MYVCNSNFAMPYELDENARYVSRRYAILVTRISSRTAKRLNDKRATGINLSSFPGWWSGNFLLIVGGNRVCRPVDQTLNSSLLRYALLPDSVTQWLYCIHQSMLHCMHLNYSPDPSCSRIRSVLHGPNSETIFAVNNN